MDSHTDLIELLKYIDPSDLDYQGWINVGMALKHEGYSELDWDTWSARDSSRYHHGECEKKWKTFQGTGMPITGATIVQIAKENGWTSSHSNDPGHELDWDDQIVIDSNWVESVEFNEPSIWYPVRELIKYLEVLFDESEYVGYVTDSWINDAGKHVPTKGNYDRTAGQLIESLRKNENDIGATIGDYEPTVGAWIRFNPLDGKGVKNDNVTEFRYALIECDDTELDKQNALIRELELPVVALVYSGNKSIHAIVRVDAADRYEYRKRVDYLYDVCRKNGLKIDQQNKNPSRLSRMPGIMRNGKKQFLIDTNIGKESWNDWVEWIESVNDDLPDPEPLEDVWGNLPELSPPLIDGVLRQGHKMLIAGPSKAGKSFLQIEMCIAIAEGSKWLGWQCAQGKVMYVNLELDRASCLHRFKDVYTAMQIPPRQLKNIDIWNLRGKSIPMDKLAPKLIRRAAKKDYIAIIIDPIYKVITGDENSADQMANFCNQFDKICTELGTSVIYCHHHSKGSQGSKKSMDRASGSGVFARDPDALLDLIELDQPESLVKQETNKAVCRLCLNYLERYNKQDEASEDDRCNEKDMLQICKHVLPIDIYERIIEDLANVRKQIAIRSAWRIDGTLREFPKFDPVNVWFDYPIHTIDYIGSLKDVLPDEELPMWKKNLAKKKDPEAVKKEKIEAVETAYSACNFDGEVTVSSMAEYLGVSEKTVRRHIKEHGGFEIKDGVVDKK